MIYVDTSVLLAELLGEDRCPPVGFWDENLISSRLLKYEVWTRLFAHQRGDRHWRAARALLARFAFLELAPPVLERALEPFPHPVRTLDALHLASIEFLHRQKQDVQVATYDRRFAAAARAMDFAVLELP